MQLVGSSDNYLGLEQDIVFPMSLNDMWQLVRQFLCFLDHIVFVAVFLAIPAKLADFFPVINICDRKNPLNYSSQTLDLEVSLKTSFQGSQAS